MSALQARSIATKARDRSLEASLEGRDGCRAFVGLRDKTGFTVRAAGPSLFTSHWNDSWFGGYYVWSHRFQNMIILLGFILFFRFATFYALERINYATR